MTDAEVAVYAVVSVMPAMAIAAFLLSAAWRFGGETAAWAVRAVRRRRRRHWLEPGLPEGLRSQVFGPKDDRRAAL